MRLQFEIKKLAVWGLCLGHSSSSSSSSSSNSLVAVLAVDLEEVVSTTNDLLEIPLFQVGPMRHIFLLVLF